ncbi:hypothetical protein Sjap_001983 [Stephania japonica]|uniref:RanBP2-type domain-containing protein n=1 Tax=Stephania japonica TaxID=461633 RepID=A0AAP0KMK6_9MAGN
MGGASKLVTLLTYPLPLLRPRAAASIRLSFHRRPALSPFATRRAISSIPRHRLGLPFNQLRRSSSTTSAARDDNYSTEPTLTATPSRVSNSWPEWANFVDSLSVCGYFDREIELGGEDLVSEAAEGLTVEFVRAVKGCVLFARDRPELLGCVGVSERCGDCGGKWVALSVQKRGGFSEEDGGVLGQVSEQCICCILLLKALYDDLNELNYEKAHTVDFMRFLLSYIWRSPEGGSLSNRDLVDSSVRNLLSEFANASRSSLGSNLSGGYPTHFPNRFEQPARPYRQQIEMKRGDWICPKCNFMNFARNMKCLECDEARPKRQLSGGEWECPQCNFFNHRRNVMCLRCDCKCPGEVAFGTSNGVGHYSESALNYGNAGTGNGLNISNRTDPSGASDSVNQTLNRILSRSATPEAGKSTATYGENDPGAGRNSVPRFESALNRQTDGRRSEYVPFVPLPADMFAKPHSATDNEKVSDGNGAPAKVDDSINSFSSGWSRDNSPSEKPAYPTESKEDKEQAEKSERWFKKVAELHDVPDLASAISDEDFPEIMPMRKGENRFVVSKKKDRSLTSPQYKRRMAMEQGNSTNYVPFVPFPPDYFAKKDKQPENGASTEKDNGGTSANMSMPQTSYSPGNSNVHMSEASDSGAMRTTVQNPGNRHDFKEQNYSFSARSSEDSRVDHSYGRPSGNTTLSSNEFQPGNQENLKAGSWKDGADGAKSGRSSTPQYESPTNIRESWKGGFSGKSLEGSLVTEPDPLDMSEEAKAQRWFRRAAQIKDISELSQIPDEDFPQIMPMRKGVNRFVVSKRKTPLERRLTSQQYRRNLPIVSSEPLKKENNEG